jgi:ssDNA-binding Zn-finger/Zn-ribbon topoisomerase 1
MAKKREQTYICPSCGKEKTIFAADHVSTAKFLQSIRNTIQCECRAWMARIEEVRAAG